MQLNTKEIKQTEEILTRSRRGPIQQVCLHCKVTGTAWFASLAENDNLLYSKKNHFLFLVFLPKQVTIFIWQLIVPNVMKSGNISRYV